ncbi:unnamed protein product [Rhizoctonia solani]|uniref:Uncharacterized protein n=1 Tax=Rhizoctonia solani TaxID=456999 RepID=A0A8H3HIT1_9AGAM|nr:unnamed protein product [Rhizoctonia solani]
MDTRIPASVLKSPARALFGQDGTFSMLEVTPPAGTEVPDAALSRMPRYVFTVNSRPASKSLSGEYTGVTEGQTNFELNVAKVISLTIGDGEFTVGDPEGNDAFEIQSGKGLGIWGPPPADVADTRADGS